MNDENPNIYNKINLLYLPVKSFVVFSAYFNFRQGSIWNHVLNGETVLFQGRIEFLSSHVRRM